MKVAIFDNRPRIDRCDNQWWEFLDRFDWSIEDSPAQGSGDHAGRVAYRLLRLLDLDGIRDQVQVRFYPVLSEEGGSDLNWIIEAFLQGMTWIGNDNAVANASIGAWDQDLDVSMPMLYRAWLTAMQPVGDAMKTMIAGCPNLVLSLAAGNSDGLPDQTDEDGEPVDDSDWDVAAPACFATAPSKDTPYPRTLVWGAHRAVRPWRKRGYSGDGPQLFGCSADGTTLLGPDGPALSYGTSFTSPDGAGLVGRVSLLRVIAPPEAVKVIVPQFHHSHVIPSEQFEEWNGCLWCPAHGLGTIYHKTAAMVEPLGWGLQAYARVMPRVYDRAMKARRGWRAR